MAAGVEMEMSKTYQYRKVMKPMLERKRRARINKCLDELKDLMIATLESEGEHITRLEKADILELTVTHLQKLKEQRRLYGNHGMILSQSECFRTGYIYAANEVSRTLSQIPGVNVSLGTQLMTHLGQRLNQIQPPSPPPSVPSSQSLPPPTIKIPTPIIPFNCGGGYSSSSYSSASSSSSPSSSASVMGQLSPMSSSRSSYTGSPQPPSTNDMNYRQTDLMLMTMGNSNGCNRDQDDNVWRPW